MLPFWRILSRTTIVDLNFLNTAHTSCGPDMIIHIILNLVLNAAMICNSHFDKTLMADGIKKIIESALMQVYETVTIKFKLELIFKKKYCIYHTCIKCIMVFSIQLCILKTSKYLSERVIRCLSVSPNCLLKKIFAWRSITLYTDVSC